jgi:K+-sensing histidine kinase KdpD
MDSEGLVDKIYGSEIKDGAKTEGLPIWVWNVINGLALIAVLLIIFLLCRLLRKEKRTIAMLKNNNDILAMSHMELEQTNHQLIEKVEKTEETLREKDELIKQVSEGINTPLNVLSGYTQILSSTDMELSDDERKKMKQDITTNTDLIISLIKKLQMPES